MSSLLRLLSTFLLTLAVAGCNRQGPPEPVLLGYLATAGTPGRQGAQLAIKEANETDGLVAGRRVALLAPNLADKDESAAAVAARLVAVNRVPALIGGDDAAQADVFGRAAQPANAFVVAPAALSAVPLAENVFPGELAPADRGFLLARFAAEHLKADHVAVLAGPAAAHADLAAAFVRQFTRDDSSRRVARHSFDDQTVWTKLAEDVHGATPKALLIAATPADYVRLRMALQETGSKAPVLYGGSLAEQLEAQADRTTGRGAYVATLYVPDGDRNYHDFAANYQKEFGEVPDAAARLGYDAAKVLIAALRRSRLVSRDRLREELAKAFVTWLDAGTIAEQLTYKLPGK